LYYARWYDRWHRLVRYERYKLVDDVTVDNVDKLHVKELIVGYPYINIVYYINYYKMNIITLRSLINGWLD
jgi:hypothetical protein